MSEPEIARRCTHCGVTLRQNALFCPQCGQQLGEQTISGANVTEAEVPETPIREKPAPTVTTHVSAPTGVAGNVRGRVEKIRHVSSVVIDQAAYDPSLRFILVAVGVFVFFLLLLILSKVIG